MQLKDGIECIGGFNNAMSKQIIDNSVVEACNYRQNGIKLV